MSLVLGKSDLLGDEELETILENCSNPESLLFALGTGVMDMRAVAATEFLRAMESLGVMHKPRPVSSMEMSGIEDVYNSIQQAFFGGEDLESD